MAKRSFLSLDGQDSDKFSSRISTHVDWEPRTNIIEVGDIVIIEVELPGVNKDDVSMVLDNDNLLVMRGVKRQPRLDESEGVTYHLFEREFGSFYKRIIIDFPLDPSRIKSIMENGVLIVKIPRKKTERISVEIK